MGGWGDLSLGAGPLVHTPWGLHLFEFLKLNLTLSARPGCSDLDAVTPPLGSYGGVDVTSSARPGGPYRGGDLYPPGTGGWHQEGI